MARSSCPYTSDMMLVVAKDATTTPAEIYQWTNATVNASGLSYDCETDSFARGDCSGTALIEFISKAKRDRIVSILQGSCAKSGFMVLSLPVQRAETEAEDWDRALQLGSTSWQWMHALAAVYGSHFPMEMRKFAKHVQSRGIQFSEEDMINTLLQRSDIHPFETTVGRMLLCCTCGPWAKLDKAVGCAPIKQRCRNVACSLQNCTMGHPLRISHATALPVDVMYGRNMQLENGCGCIDQGLTGVCDSDCGFCSRYWKFGNHSNIHVPISIFTRSPPLNKSEDSGKKKQAKREVFFGQISCPAAASARGNRVTYDREKYWQSAPSIEASLKQELEKVCKGAELKSFKLQSPQNHAHPFAFGQFKTQEGADLALAAMGKIHIDGIYLIISPKFERKSNKQTSVRTVSPCTNVPTSSMSRRFH